MLAATLFAVRYWKRETVSTIPRTRATMRPRQTPDITSSNNIHSNIQILTRRMDDAFSRQDYAGVLQASASIFETMAKDVVNMPSVQNKSLGQFFERYRKSSSLPPEILDYILAIYARRNVVPLAGHGSTGTPGITRQEAVTLVEMTKAFVKMEYKLRQ